MHETASPENTHRILSILAAIAGAVGLLIAIRHALLLAKFAHLGGAPHTAIGFALVTALAMVAVIGSVMLLRGCNHAQWVFTAINTHTIALTWIIYALIAVPALIFSVPEGWDEARHVLYGMYLRGYSVSGDPMSWFVVRSPMASFLSALVFPFTQIINPVLLAALIAVMLAWCRRYAHPTMMLFVMLAFIANDHFMQAIWAVMGELPGALFLVAAFYLLARDRFVLCAVCFALAVLSRWNLAPFALIGVLFVAMRFSIRQALIMTAIGAGIFGLWVAKSWLVAGPPWELLREYATHAHAFTDGSGPRPGVRPSLLGRLDFYTAACYFQTLPALIAIVVSPFVPRINQPKANAELFRYWIPAALVLYFLCITLTGGYFPRLAIVTFPLSLLVLVEVAWSARGYAGLAPRLLIPVMLLLLPISAATGVERYEVVTMIGRKVLQAPPLPPAVARAIRQHTSPRDVIIMPRFYKITRHSDGRHLRVYTRRDIRIFPDLTNPSFNLMFNRTLDDEIRDFGFQVDLFVERMIPGTTFLLPQRYKDRLPPEDILFEQEGWILARTTQRDHEGRINDPSSDP